MNRYQFLDKGRQHLHTLDGKPLIGGSTAKGIIGKGDGLVQWSAGCAVDYIKENAEVELDEQGTPTGVLYTEEADLEAARTAWKKKRDGAAKVGTERHGLLEDYVRDCIANHEGRPVAAKWTYDIAQFVEWATANVDRFLFAEANCYSERLWVGGIADIGMVLKDGRRVVGDHKSSKAAYFDQFIQTALYDILLSESGGLTPQGDKLFEWEKADGYVIFPFRSSPFTPEYRWDADRYRKAAEDVVNIYKLSETN